MAEPYNYMLNLPDPSQGMMSGIQNGLMLSSVIDKADQQKQAEAQQAQMQADLGRISQNPTPAALAQLMVKYPSMSEQFKRTYDTLNTEQQKSRLDQATQVYSALQSGKPEIAKQLLTDQAAAYRNSGSDNEAKTLEDIGKLVEISPDTAKTTAGLFLAHAMGPDKFTETFTKLQSEQRSSDKAPYELTEAQAKAQKAAVDSKFAESQAALDLQKKGWDITKIQEDIAITKQNSQIAALNAATSRESNEIKKQELQQKLDEMKAKRDEAIRTKAGEAENSFATIDTSVKLIDDILADKDTLRAIVGASAWKGSIPGTDNRAMVGKIEQLQNTLAAANLDKLKGAMSDKDILFLKNITSNLDRYQDEDKFINELTRINGELFSSRKRVASKYGIPEPVINTPDVEPTAQEIEEFTRTHNPAYRGAARRE